MKIVFFYHSRNINPVSLARLKLELIKLGVSINPDIPVEMICTDGTINFQLQKKRRDDMFKQFDEAHDWALHIAPNCEHVKENPVYSIPTLLPLCTFDKKERVCDFHCCPKLSREYELGV